jgi:hypothetical protein
MRRPRRFARVQDRGVDLAVAVPVKKHRRRSEPKPKTPTLGGTLGGLCAEEEAAFCDDGISLPESLEHHVGLPGGSPESDSAPKEPTLLSGHGQEYDRLVAHRLHCGPRNDYPSLTAAAREHHAGVHAEPETASRVRHFHSDLGGASLRIHPGIDVAHAATEH